MVRGAFIALYAGFAALGAALLARPAVLWVQGLGLTRPVRPWHVPLGWAAALLAAVLAAFAFGMAVHTAVGGKPRRRHYLAFLLLVALALLLRAVSGDIRPPPQIEALPGDLPGTIYVCISSDEQRAWLSALSLHRVLPATVQANAGTHSAPGLDPLLPLYPNAR